VCATKIFLEVCFTATLFTLISAPDVDAFGRLRNRHACCAGDPGVPWYAYCYPVKNSKDSSTATTQTCTPPPNNPSANYCVCCKGGDWARCNTPGTCDGACFCIDPDYSASPARVLGPCPKGIPPYGDFFKSDYNCAYVFDNCTQKLRYAYPIEYHNPKVYGVVYGPMGAVSGGCASCSR
jgi:hypothetical protein